MIKVFLKLLLSIIIYSIVYIITMVILPFSQGLMEVDPSFNPMSTMVFLPIKAAFICLTMYFVIKNTCFSGKKLFLNLILVMFFVASFTQHIDTLFIGSAFPAMTRWDIIMNILSGLFPLLATAPLLVHFFQNKNGIIEKLELNIKSLIIKLGIIGIIYLFIYMLFGLFFIMRIEEIRLFYSTIEISPIKLVPFQILRGILFCVFILPLKNMIKTKKIFIISICLVYLCTAVDLILPNALLPTKIRIAHLIEMTTSMTLFGIIVGNIMWRKQKTDA